MGKSFSFLINSELKFIKICTSIFMYMMKLVFLFMNYHYTIISKQKELELQKIRRSLVDLLNNGFFEPGRHCLILECTAYCTDQRLMVSESFPALRDSYWMVTLPLPEIRNW